MKRWPALLVIASALVLLWFVAAAMVDAVFPVSPAIREEVGKTVYIGMSPEEYEQYKAWRSEVNP